MQFGITLRFCPPWRRDFLFSILTQHEQNPKICYSNFMKNPRIAIVHDFLLHLGGAERVTAVLAKIFPKAPIYTLLYDEKNVGKVFPREKVITSHLQNLPNFIRRHHRFLLPLFPSAIERFDFSKFDVVISSSNSFAHGIITPVKTKHICYYHSPMRYIWDYSAEYLQEHNFSGIKKILALKTLNKIRIWDYFAGQRPDVVIANSQHVQKRIQKYYRRESEVIYPPVKTVNSEQLAISSLSAVADEQLAVKKTSDLKCPKRPLRSEVANSQIASFLILSALTPFKKIDLAIKAFNQNGEKLIIAGEGRQKKYLQSIAKSNIEFTGFVDDTEVDHLLSQCRALIFPGEEDFGITPVEAMAHGKPVLAFGHGGVTETVVSGVTGEFFNKPTVESLLDGLNRLLANEKKYDFKKIQAQARKFDEKVFEEKIKKLVI